LDFDCKVFQNGQDPQLVTWIFFSRLMELNQIQKEFSMLDVSENDDLYKEIIFDLVLAERIELKKCISLQ